MSLTSLLFLAAYFSGCIAALVRHPVYGLITYVLTMERTASFWDCGEFIACAFKLQVPHPPGAPLFLLIGRLFALLALGDVMKVAYWINMVSVLSSAFTIFFYSKPSV